MKIFMKCSVSIELDGQSLLMEERKKQLLEKVSAGWWQGHSFKKARELLSAAGLGSACVAEGGTQRVQFLVASVKCWLFGVRCLFW